MPQQRITGHLPAPQQDALDALLRRCRAHDGREAVNDHLAVALRDLALPDAARTVPDGTAPTALVLVETGADLVAVAAGTPVGSTWVLGLAVDPDHRHALAEVATPALADLLDHVAHHGGGHVNWWVTDADDAHHRVAAALGLAPGRELLQMTVTLPLADDGGITTRPFRVGEDEDAWLTVNNRAFAWHDEQGSWDRATLAARLAADWFEADGFLLHERGEHLAGFCWTKIHRDVDPPVGEIYVIGVDPSAQGGGLGRALTLAGLDSIARRDVHTGMLFVDADNTAAVTLYDRLGFVVARRDLAFTATLSASRADIPETAAASTADPGATR